MDIIECRSENDDYHPDITPIILAAHHNNYQIVKVRRSGSPQKNLQRVKSTTIASFTVVSIWLCILKSSKIYLRLDCKGKK